MLSPSPGVIRTAAWLSLSLSCRDLLLGFSFAGSLMDENLVREFDARGGVWRLLSSLAVSIINMLIQSNIINRVNIFFFPRFLFGKQQKKNNCWCHCSMSFPVLQPSTQIFPVWNWGRGKPGSQALRNSNLGNRGFRADKFEMF